MGGKLERKTREEIARGERWGKSREGNAGRIASGREALEKTNKKEVFEKNAGANRRRK